MHAVELLSRFEAGERDFRGADLQGAELAQADLRGADLRGAFLVRADLRAAHLDGANLRRAISFSSQRMCWQARAKKCRAVTGRASPNAWSSRWAGAVQHPLQGVGVHRLDQMLLEAGLVRAAAVLVLPVGGHGEQTGLGRGGDDP